MRLRMLVFFAAAGAVFAADPIVGTWKLNVTKSHPAQGRAFPTDATATVAVEGSNYEVSGTQNYGDGKSISAKFTVPVSGGVETYIEGALPPGTTGDMKRIDERTVDFSTSRNGKEVQTIRLSISRDGKTLQRTIKGTDAQGKPFEVMEVYDKQ